MYLIWLFPRFVLAPCIVRYDNKHSLSFCAARDTHFSALVRAVSHPNVVTVSCIQYCVYIIIFNETPEQSLERKSNNVDAMAISRAIKRTSVARSLCKAKFKC